MTKSIFAFVALSIISPFHLEAADVLPSLESRVLDVFAELERIRPMVRGSEYRVLVGGREESGPKELFLRRRSGSEIWASGLASGCGDYAIAFIERIEADGVEVYLVDGAEVSEQSLASHFSGHSVVALRDRSGTSDWWLVDPTQRVIVSRGWNSESKTFRSGDRVYWIAYCGRLQDYQVHNADQIRAFYGQALDSIPPSTLSDLLLEKKQRAEPGATDNPDDAQHSREDH